TPPATSANACPNCRASRRPSRCPTSPPPIGGSRRNAAPASRYPPAAAPKPAGTDQETNVEPSTAPVNAATMPITADVALAVTSSVGATVRGSTAPLAASTKREEASSTSTPAYASSSDRVSATSTAATAIPARNQEVTTRVARRGQRSISTPANGPTRVN